MEKALHKLRYVVRRYPHSAGSEPVLQEYVEISSPDGIKNPEWVWRDVPTGMENDENFQERI